MEVSDRNGSASRVGRKEESRDVLVDGFKTRDAKLLLLTVCRMSRTANRPKGGKEEKLSTHMGLDGIILTRAASPDLMNLGLVSTDLPVRRSIFSVSSENLQAMWAVWQSRTGE